METRKKNLSALGGLRQSFRKDPGPWSGLILKWMAALGIILVFGLLMLFSASYTTGYLRHGQSYYFIRGQAIYMAVGLFGMWAASHLDYHWWKQAIFPLYGLCVVMLVWALFCEPISGCHRWVRLMGFSFQVSELVKFEVILFTANEVGVKASFGQRLGRRPKKSAPARPSHGGRKKRGNPLTRAWKAFWQSVCHLFVDELATELIVLLPLLLLLVIEPHLSGTILVCAIAGTILLASGRGGWLTVSAALSVVGSMRFLLRHIDAIEYVKKRLDGWTTDIDRMTDQTRQSLYAISSGQLTGVGFGNSVQKQLWLPECTNDFVFSVICEELGFVGAMLVIALFVFFLLSGLSIAFQAEDLFGKMVGVGIMAQIGWQVFLNIAVVTNSIPNTGIGFPFFSSGGSALILLLVEMGVFLNIGRSSTRTRLERKRAEREQQNAERRSRRRTIRETENTIRL